MALTRAAPVVSIGMAALNFVIGKASLEGVIKWAAIVVAIGRFAL